MLDIVFDHFTNIKFLANGKNSFYVRCDYILTIFNQNVHIIFFILFSFTFRESS
jgi:hypothetical protein